MSKQHLYSPAWSETTPGTSVRAAICSPALPGTCTRGKCAAARLSACASVANHGRCQGIQAKIRKPCRSWPDLTIWQSLKIFIQAFSFRTSRRLCLFPDPGLHRRTQDVWAGRAWSSYRREADTGSPRPQRHGYHGSLRGSRAARLSLLHRW